ncbi:MAG: YdcF family protein [Rhodocyclales bacterium]|nr:YdcF family protein [Rhodocyclales bacterium]
MFLLKKLVVALILPPTGPLLLALLGLWLARSKSRLWRQGGLWLTILALLGLLALSLPIVGKTLMAPLEPNPPITQAQLQRVQAIVVLGGGSYYAAPEYDGDTVGYRTLERLRYGARLARESRLPLLVTGGAPFGGRPEAESMREVLESEFGVKVRWVEGTSRDTAENASLSAPMLKAAGVTRIALVSHGWHLPRAIPLFEKQGLEVTAAPTSFSTVSPSLFKVLLPGGLVLSRQALNEYLGQLYNHLKDIK